MKTMSAIAIAAATALCAVRTAAQNAPPVAVTQIYPGDVIRLAIWREPDLSGAWTVSPDGVVVFPKLGPRTVTGRSVEEFRESLLNEYAQYLINPSIQIDVQRKVQILGAVRQPGVFNLEPTMTIRDALALAGGVTPDGNADRVELRRNDEVVEVKLRVRTAVADAPIRSGDQLYVPERPYLARNTAALGALISGSVGLLVALLVR